MAGRRLNRWHKTGAIVPVGLLIGAWTVALAGSGTAIGTHDAQALVPEVPEAYIAQPASVGDTLGASGEDLSEVSAGAIPATANRAYHRAEHLLAQADPDCGLSWTLLAAIGHVESHHGEIADSELDPRGNATPPIYGVPLDGTNGTARLPDTDAGALDDDPVWDRAVGPMQFIPTTWAAVGLDADGDGVADPQSIYDSSAAAGVYLCAGEGDLGDRTDAEAALFRYNRSDDYVRTVLALSDAYASGSDPAAALLEPSTSEGGASSTEATPDANPEAPSGSSGRGTETSSGEDRESSAAPEPPVAHTDFAVSEASAPAYGRIAQNLVTTRFSATAQGTPREHEVVAVIEFDHTVRYRGTRSSAWFCEASEHDRLTQLRCTTRAAGSVPDLEVKAQRVGSVHGSVTVDAPDNDDPDRGNDTARF